MSNALDFNKSFISSLSKNIYRISLSVESRNILLFIIIVSTLLLHL